MCASEVLESHHYIRFKSGKDSESVTGIVIEVQRGLFQ